jgi:nucleoside-triphosphatase THEP1
MTPENEFTAVVITGTIGVGKSTTADALGQMLVQRGVTVTVIDMDALRETHPRPPSDRFHTQLGYRNLASVVRNGREAGAKIAVIADVVESADGCVAYQRAIPDADIRIVRLTVSSRANQDRILQRSRRIDRAWELERAVELTAIMDAADIADVSIETDDRTADDVAREIAAWLGLGA